MSRNLTPPEPVTSTRCLPAVIITPLKALPPLVRLWSAGKALAGVICGSITIALGWPPFFSSDQNQQPNLLPLTSRAGRVGFSHNNNTWRHLVLLLFGLTLAFFHPLAAAAAPAPASTVPTRLIIPSIALDSAVVPVGWKEVKVNGQTYSQWEVDKNLVGWHNLSAPLGQAGNSVLNGHSNVHAQVFRNLDQVKVGDPITAVANDQVYSYIVAAKILVQEKGVPVEQRLENAKLILPTPDERLTLVTCAFAGATHRLIIVAYPEHK